jgi:hypothetical protein
MAPPPRPRAAPSSPHVPVWAEGASADLGNLGLAPLESGLADHAAPTATLTPSPSSGTPAVEQNAEWRTPKTPVRQHAPYPVQTFDESAGGYCIRWPVEHPTKVKVGEILGIRSGEDNARFAVGVVRWMRQDPARELELGVQIIASRCQPGDIGTTRMKHRARDPEKPHHNCLLLPETRPDERDTSLVTTAANIEPGSTLWLSTRGIERRIKLTRIMESCGAFTRYEFQLIGEEETPKRSSGTPGHGFDDLWNQL